MNLEQFRALWPEPITSSLDLNFLLTGTPIRMRYVNRWSTSQVSFPENVAEHSYFVCLYAMFVARWVCDNHFEGSKMNSCSKRAFLGDVLQKAILHDLEEARTGDIHRPFKYSSPELKASMRNAGVIAAKQTLGPLVEPDASKDELLRLWLNSKNGSLSGRIVRFADLMAVVAFSLQEGKNATFKLSLETLEGHMNDFDHADYDFIRPLVEQLKPLVKEVLG